MDTVTGNMVQQVVGVPFQQQAAQNQTQGIQQQTVAMQQPAGAQVVQQGVSQPSAQMFTQEQVNSIVSGRVNALNQKVQELTTLLTASQQNAATYFSELNAYRQRETVNKAGVPAQFADFVIFEASKLAVNGKSFEDAVKEYTASNQQLLVQNQMGMQANAAVSPVSQQATQVVATPAQQPQTQNFQPVVATQATVGAQAAGVVPQQSNTVVVPQAQVVSQPVIQTQPVVVGQTGFSNPPNVGAVHTINSDVTAFLKTKGIGK